MTEDCERYLRTEFIYKVRWRTYDDANLG